MRTPKILRLKSGRILFARQPAGPSFGRLEESAALIAISQWILAVTGPSLCRLSDIALILVSHAAQAQTPLRVALPAG